MAILASARPKRRETAMKYEEYLLGHSNCELERLARQAKQIAPATREYFREAGMAHGMRVLDVGSGTGDVAFLAADLIGPSGEVICTDIAPAAVAVARDAADQRGLRQVSFLEGDPSKMTFEEPFDFVVGRYVLAHQADPKAMLRGLTKHLRPGGMMVFQDPDWSFVSSDPVAPTYDRCCRWAMDAAGRSGIRIVNAVTWMHRAFVGAGLKPPTMRMRTMVGDAVGVEDWLRSVADVVVTMLPTIEKYGIATSADAGIDTLSDRIVREVASGGGIVIGRAEIGAWSQV
jgi:SAM-dependent methyltransferase